MIKKLGRETETKDELIEQLQEMRSKSEVQKSKKAANKKEISSLSKAHKQEILKLQEEIRQIKEKWTDPEEIKKMQKKEKDLEAQLSRQRDLISNLKKCQEKAELEVSKVTESNESKKEDIDKISKLSREISRKDATIKELKMLIQELKEKEDKLSWDLKLSSTKLKAAKADLVRKESMLKETKEKFEGKIEEVKSTSENSVDQNKYKEMVKKYKQEIERKDLKISSLESKVESNSSEIEKLKFESTKENKSTKAEYSSQSKKYETTVKKYKKAEETTQIWAVVIRRIIKEMILMVEKLRSDALISHQEMSIRNKSSLANQTNLQEDSTKIDNRNSAYTQDDNLSDIYKESLDILGVSPQDLDEFMQPASSYSGSKVAVGPSLKVEDLGFTSSSNKDLEIFTKALEAIVDDPSQLLTESEDIIKIFKKLLKEISSLESGLASNKSASLSYSKTSQNLQNYMKVENIEPNNDFEMYIKNS